MKMSELILAVGDDNVIFQNLDKSATAINYGSKAGTTITFGTQEAVNFITGGTEKLGLVVWLPRDKVTAALDAEKR